MTLVTKTDGPVTLITGGGSGIGAATTRRLLDLGHRVTVTGRDADRLNKFAAELVDAGIEHTPGNMHSVTKWAVTGMAENVRLMVAAAGIGVTTIAPGPVETPFWDHHPRHRSPSPVVLSADDIAATVAWVLSQPAGVDVNTVVVRPTGQAG